jgi:hypothetical protein
MQFQSELLTVSCFRQPRPKLGAAKNAIFEDEIMEGEFDVGVSVSLTFGGGTSPRYHPVRTGELVQYDI